MTGGYRATIASKRTRNPPSAGTAVTNRTRGCRRREVLLAGLHPAALRRGAVERQQSSPPRSRPDSVACPPARAGCARPRGHRRDRPQGRRSAARATGASPSTTRRRCPRGARPPRPARWSARTGSARAERTLLRIVRPVAAEPESAAVTLLLSLSGSGPRAPRSCYRFDAVLAPRSRFRLCLRAAVSGASSADADRATPRAQSRRSRRSLPRSGSTR